MLLWALVLLCTGLLVGFFCGLLGVGGGFLMVPVQILALTAQGVDSTLATRIAFGTSLAVVLPTALSGCRWHSCRGAVLWRPGIIMGLSGMLGGLTGGFIASQLPGEMLRMAFGLVILLAATRMLLAGAAEPLRAARVEPKRGGGDLLYVLLGLGVGAVSGLAGIGGGVMLVPAMVVVLGFGMYQAIGTSSVVIAFNALGGVMAYAINGWGVPGLPEYCLGYIDIMQFALLSAASILSAGTGAGVAHRLSTERLRGIFVILMMIIGLKMTGALDLFGL